MVAGAREQSLMLILPKHVIDRKQKPVVGRPLSRSYQQCELGRKHSDYFRQRRIDTGRVVNDVSSLAVT